MDLNTLFFIKIGVLIVLFFYIIFTLVILNQVRAMDKIISQATSSPVIIFLAIIQSALALFLFLFALAIL